MGLQVEVKFNGVDDVAVDNGARFAVAALPIRLAWVVWIDGEESDVVSLANHDDSDVGSDSLSRAGSYSKYLLSTTDIDVMLDITNL